MADSPVTTLRDLHAASMLGALSPDTEVIRLADARKIADAAVASVRAEASAWVREQQSTIGEQSAPNTVDHRCTMVGCTHGSHTHAGVSQPDRQIKLACDRCLAVARMTASALVRAGGYPTCADGGHFVEAARRQYTRKSV